MKEWLPTTPRVNNNATCSFITNLKKWSNFTLSYLSHPLTHHIMPHNIMKKRLSALVWPSQNKLYLCMENILYQATFSVMLLFVTQRKKNRYNSQFELKEKIWCTGKIFQAKLIWLSNFPLLWFIWYQTCLSISNISACDTHLDCDICSESPCSIRD